MFTGAGVTGTNNWRKMCDLGILLFYGLTGAVVDLAAIFVKSFAILLVLGFLSWMPIKYNR